MEGLLLASWVALADTGEGCDADYPNATFRDGSCWVSMDSDCASCAVYQDRAGDGAYFYWDGFECGPGSDVGHIYNKEVWDGVTDQVWYSEDWTLLGYIETRHTYCCDGQAADTLVVGSPDGSCYTPVRPERGDEISPTGACMEAESSGCSTAGGVGLGLHVLGIALLVGRRGR